MHRVAPTARHGAKSTKLQRGSAPFHDETGSRPMSGPEGFGAGGTSASEVPPLVINPMASFVTGDATVIAHPASRNSSPAEVTLEPETQETLRQPVLAPPEEENAVTIAEE